MKIFSFYGLLMICCCSCVVNDILRDLPFCTPEISLQHRMFVYDSLLVFSPFSNRINQISICSEPEHGILRFLGINQVSYHPNSFTGLDSFTFKVVEISQQDTSIIEFKQLVEVFLNPQSRCLDKLFELPDTLHWQLGRTGDKIPETAFAPVDDHCFGFIRTIHILQLPKSGQARIQYESNADPVLIYSNDNPIAGDVDEFVYKICVKVDGVISCRNFVLQIEVIS